MGGRCAVLLDWWVGGEMGAGRAVKIFLFTPTATAARVRFLHGAGCGDMTSKAPGVGKCYTEHGGNVVGTPTCDRVDSYAWVYRWKATSTSN
jgi:hypothetical protein